MTQDEINELKREHNKLMDEGGELMAQIEEKFQRVMEIRKTVEEFDKDDYDPIEIMFAGKMRIDGVLPE